MQIWERKTDLKLGMEKIARLAQEEDGTEWEIIQWADKLFDKLKKQIERFSWENDEDLTRKTIKHQNQLKPKKESIIKRCNVNILKRNQKAELNNCTQRKNAWEL